MPWSQLPRSAALLGLALAAVLGSGCFTPAPRPEAWLATGFRSPRQAFATFQTALAGGRPELEYRCFSAGFRKRESLSLLAYSEARERLLSERPWLTRLACAKVVAERRESADSVWLVAHVDTWFAHADFELRLVREGFYELYDEATRAQDGALAGRAPWSLDGNHLKLELELEPPTPRISELRAGFEWKIDEFRALDR